MGGYIEQASGEIADILLQVDLDYTQTTDGHQPYRI